jgi:hypothetical protein
MIKNLNVGETILIDSLIFQVDLSGKIYLETYFIVVE